MNIVIPMAGRGSRFTDRGYKVPKPLIPVATRPMLARAMDSLKGLKYHRLIVIALQKHEDDYGVTALTRDLIGPDIEVILLPDVTEGQLCTVLTARDFIDTDDAVLIASSDTFVVSNLAHDIAGLTDDSHGVISVANLSGDRWSFARTDETGRVVEVAEKVRISDYASTGIYYFTSGRELVEIGDEMIRRGEKIRGEYYVIPVYQKYIERGWRVDISSADEMWDMGTPDALQIFETHLATRNQTTD
jgi:UDP-N-acetylglucosamine diphosphorylase / glucose-1-phosphate thymidylyltransferase / UDP-N-acetylgalactosamine diphosphorylase / glucosamine-1-phosphate N-acetyltransferase / galactosamine-1-phosphate N-acetyltransferase